MIIFLSVAVQVVRSKLQQPQSVVAVGQGKVDFSAIMKAAGAHTEWLIVELDRCASDMMVAVEQSYQYLAGQGLGRGRQ